MKKYLKILGFLPVLSFMILIFDFSLAPAIESFQVSDGLSYKRADERMR